MNIELLKSKTVLASVALLVLSVVRVAMGDATALQGVQEAVMALVPIFLRAAISKTADKAADAAAEGAAAGAEAWVASAVQADAVVKSEAVREAATPRSGMPAAGDQ